MSQIFKKDISKDFLFDFLEKCCTIQKNKYIFNKSSYKKAQLLELITLFCSNLKPYYYKSKQHYLERNMSYKNVITIIRQLCKFTKIPFTSNIAYSKSKYEITYYIFQE